MVQFTSAAWGDADSLPSPESTPYARRLGGEPDNMYSRTNSKDPDEAGDMSFTGQDDEGGRSINKEWRNIYSSDDEDFEDNDNENDPSLVNKVCFSCNILFVVHY
jgi:hypothetical protein